MNVVGWHLVSHTEGGKQAKGVSRALRGIFVPGGGGELENGKNCTARGFIFCTRDEMKVGEVDGACSTHGRDENAHQKLSKSGHLRRRSSCR
jgi:hypothetical protein